MFANLYGRPEQTSRQPARIEHAAGVWKSWPARRDVATVHSGRSIGQNQPCLIPRSAGQGVRARACQRGCRARPRLPTATPLSWLAPGPRVPWRSPFTLWLRGDPCGVTPRPPSLWDRRPRLTRLVVGLCQPDALRSRHLPHLLSDCAKSGRACGSIFQEPAGRPGHCDLKVDSACYTDKKRTIRVRWGEHHHVQTFLRTMKAKKRFESDMNPCNSTEPQ